ncbi:MAG: DUF1266 domain-containing protein [Lentimicrobiaceae bacterium]|nr:DUF1266 domain-containing protein [Lentimicrobiaceae bacterium]
MKKLIYTTLLGIILCLTIVTPAIAQNTQAQDAAKEEQAAYDAQNKRTHRTIFLIIIVCSSMTAIVFFIKNKSTVLSILSLFTGGFRTKGDITTLESKKILTGAMYALQQGAYLNTLNASIGDKLYTILSEWWGINDRDSAIDTLNYLRDKGYNYYFPTVYKAFSATSDHELKEIILAKMTTQEDAEKAYSQAYNLLESVDLLKELNTIERTEEIEKYGVVGWDAGRLIFIARLCYDAQYIEEEEAWTYIDVAYAQAQRAFKSWEELAKSYVIGRFIWRGKDADDGMQLLANDLINKNKSPWKQVEWRS